LIVIIKLKKRAAPPQQQAEHPGDYIGYGKDVWKGGECPQCSNHYYTMVYGGVIQCTRCFHRLNSEKQLSNESKV